MLTDSFVTIGSTNIKIYMFVIEIKGFDSF